MSKTALTKQIELNLFGYTKSGNAGIYGAYEVTFGAAYGDERVDYVTLKSNGEIRCYEIKVSKADFRSKAKLSFYGDYNYYVMPEELYNDVKKEVPWTVGVIVLKPSGSLKEARKAGKRTVPPWQRYMVTHCMVRSLSRLTGKFVEQELIEDDTRRQTKSLCMV